MRSRPELLERIMALSVCVTAAKPPAIFRPRPGYKSGIVSLLFFNCSARRTPFCTGMQESGSGGASELLFVSNSDSCWSISPQLCERRYDLESHIQDGGY